jgi:hypothetical protein
MQNRVWVGKSEVKELFGRLRPRWQNNSKMDLEGTG